MTTTNRAIALVVLALLVAPAAANGYRYRQPRKTVVVNLQPPTYPVIASPPGRDRLALLTKLGPGTVRLSNERTVTQWANPSYRGPVYVHPDGRSRRIGRLHMRTEEGFPEVYLLLAAHLNKQGRVWVRVRIPARPNGQTGWVRRSALGPFEISRWLLVIDRRAERLTAYHSGHRLFAAPVGIGKPTTPTPAGRFWIRERFRVPDPSSPYFPYAIGTSDYSTLSEWPGGGVVGIHGDWNQPWLIPGDPSHGCIRMHNPDISWLAPRVPVGTPLHII